MLGWVEFLYFSITSLLSLNEGVCGAAFTPHILIFLFLKDFFPIIGFSFSIKLLLKIKRNLFCLIYFGFFIFIFYFRLSMIFTWVFGLCGVSVSVV